MTTKYFSSLQPIDFLVTPFVRSFITLVPVVNFIKHFSTVERHATAATESIHTCMQSSTLAHCKLFITLAPVVDYNKIYSVENLCFCSHRMYIF